MPRRKALKFPGRPWMLGTDEIPPPLRVPFQMWSRSSDPHQQGLVQFEFTEEGLAARWFGDSDVPTATMSSMSIPLHGPKTIIEWHELAWLAGGLPRDVEAEIEWLKEKAAHESAVQITGDWLAIVQAGPQRPETYALVERCCKILEGKTLSI